MNERRTEIECRYANANEVLALVRRMRPEGFGLETLLAMISAS